MLTKLTPNRLTTTSTFTSPPSRALANYARASGGPAAEVTDSVTLSEQAKSKPAPTSGLRKIGTFAALALSFVGIMGTVGCTGGATAAAPQPQAETVQDSTQSSQVVDLKSDPAPADSSRQDRSPRLHPNLQGRSAEDIAEQVGREGRKVGEQVAEGLKEGGERLRDVFKDKDAEEIAESIGQEGRRLGKQIGEEGKKIGQEAAEAGKEIGKVAKGFWRGLTGKSKK